MPGFMGRSQVGTTILKPGGFVGGGPAGTLIIGPGLRNGDFETLGAGGADVFADWAEAKAGSSTINAETSIVDSGTYSCRLDIDASNSIAELDLFAITAGHRYRVELRARADSGTPRISVNDLVEITLSAAWTTYSGTFTAVGTAFFVKRSVGSGGRSLYIDNILLYDLGT